MKLSAQIPLVEYFSEESFGGHKQSFGATEDSSGLLYIANGNGVIITDGKFQQLIPLPNSSPARSILQLNNEIFVGGVNEFGKITRQPNRNFEYQSLKHHFSNDSSSFKEVFYIKPFNGSVAFFTDQKIFFYSGKDNFSIRPERDDDSFYAIYSVNDRLFIDHNKSGLKEYTKEGNFISLSSEDEEFKYTYFSILPHSKDSLLFFSIDKGIFITHANQVPLKLRPWYNEINEELKEANIYRAIKLKNNNYLIGTLANGAYLINSEGELIHHYHQSNGLESETVLELFESNRQEAIISLNKGLARVNLSPDLQYWQKEQSPFQSNITFFDEIDNNIYAGNILSLFTWNGNKFQQKKQFSQVNAIQSLQDSKGKKQLLVGSGDGLMISQGDHEQWKEWHKKIKYIYDIIPRKNKNNEWLILHQYGLESVRLVNDTITSNNDFIELDGRPHKIIPLENKLMVGTYYNGVYFLTEKNGKLETTSHIVQGSAGTDSAGFNRLYQAKDRIFRSSSIERVVQEFNFKRQEFENVEDPVLFNSYIRQNVFYQGKDLLFLQSAEGFKLYDPITETSFDESIDDMIQYAHYKGFSFNNILIDNENQLWLSGNQLLKLDLNKKHIKPLLKAYIYALEVSNDTTYYFPDTTYQLKDIDFYNNRIIFKYAVNDIDFNKDWKYAYRLIGYNDKWSEYSTDNTREYMNLMPGEYSFEVRAKGPHGISEIGRIHFQISKPIYLRTEFIIIYFLGLIGIVYLIIYWNGRRLIRSNQKLNDLVRQRTKDLEEKNHEIEQQNTQLVKTNQEIVRQKNLLEKSTRLIRRKNTEISESIRYAANIQKSILPLEEDLEAFFGPICQFFLPKEVVSGDFYWFHRLNKDKAFFAVIDCTGHGVPGAIMSIVAYDLLNQCVSNHPDSNPAELIQLVNKSLKDWKLKSRSANNDGMDISIILMDKANRLVQFAHAGTSIFTVKSNNGTYYRKTNYELSGVEKRDIQQLKNTKISFDDFDHIYLYTDGYSDQFGGRENKKYMMKRFKKMLLNLSEDPKEASKQLVNNFHDWKGDQEQIDDVLVMRIDRSENNPL
ncbi:MAG: SpoIIE family protein phosphatase [Cyclobacteriaceae bacterium]|nr:SpoIIE family protein phosphatase [Cyclobacteriaceae bacterium]MCH8515337.1 SpoIIE family protein phosphatase [Cyclobacteriaceae bacterium]